MTAGKRIVSSMVLFAFIAIVPFNSEGGGVREPAVAGSFYPADPVELSSLIKGLYRGRGGIPVRNENITGILAPHAGYVYSGKTAGLAYREIVGSSYDLVILLGPSHYVRIDKAAMMKEGAFRTPLGVVGIDSDVAERIYAHSPELFADSLLPFKREHSLEAQLPFLQVALGEFAFIPIEVNTLDGGFLEKLADAIYREVQGRKVLVVASTDLSHYRSRADTAVLDGAFQKRILELDHRSLSSDLMSGKSEACGGSAALLALMVLKKLGATSVYITDYADSGEVTGDDRSVVGYLSALVLGKGSKVYHERRGEMRDREGMNPEYLSGEEKRQLLEIARQTIVKYVKEGKVPEVSVQGDALKNPGAAFVTIEIGGKLRGCIGYTEAVYPLYRTVMECAVSSATEDPRFPPLSIAELKKMEIEISVLTPLEKVKDLSLIEVGKHGLMVSRGSRRGLLLPQVAVNNRWDRDAFLSQTCVKAGLPSDEWKKGIEIYSFEAEVFGEKMYR